MPSRFLRGVVFVFIIFAAAPLLTASIGRYCRNCPREWYSISVIQGFGGFDVTATSDPDPMYFCERFQKTSVSADGKTAHYNVVYRNAGCNYTALADNQTFVAANNRDLYVTSERDPGVNRLRIFYLVKHTCFVAQSNRTNEFYLLDYFLRGIEHDHSCFEKLAEYAGGNITFLRDQYQCKNIPPNP